MEAILAALALAEKAVPVAVDAFASFQTLYTNYKADLSTEDLATLQSRITTLDAQAQTLTTSTLAALDAAAAK